MDAEVSTHTLLAMIIYLFYVVWTNFFCNCSYVVHTEYIFISIFINWTVHMSDNLPERVQILGHTHIICITVREDRIICCQIFCDLLLKSAFEWIFNVMQLILVKIKWYIKWKYLIQKFHDICPIIYSNLLLNYPQIYYNTRLKNLQIMRKWHSNLFFFPLLLLDVYYFGGRKGNYLYKDV
jgi:hypothetical protein